MIEKIEQALSDLRLHGIECYSSWLRRGDGPYIIARNPLWAKSNPSKCIEFLVPIDDESYESFIKFIKEKIKLEKGWKDEE